MSALEQPFENEGGELPPHVKLLKRVVYIMGVILLLLFVALIAGIVWKAKHRQPEAAPGPQVLDLGLPAGVSVKQMMLDGDRLALDIGSEVLVVDTRRNVVLQRILLAPK
jgi:hypothetical protein